MNRETKTYEYKAEYGDYTLRPWLNKYANNNQLALGFDYYVEGDDSWEAFSMATINVGTVPYLYGCIDTNDNGTRMVKFLEENGFGQDTGYFMSSGFCQYPIFKFNEEKLKEIDPKVFAEYSKAHGVDTPPLEEQISSAEALKGNPGQERVSEEPER